MSLRPAPLLFLLFAAAGCYVGVPWEGAGADVPGNDDDAANDDDAGDDDDANDDTLPPATTTLITVDDTARALVLVDEATGVGTHIVDLNPPQSMCSSVFTRAGTLFTSRAGTLFTLDPCTGDVTTVGDYSNGATICGLASDNLNSLYGLDRDADELVSIDPATAAVTSIGPTGVDFANHGLTWDDAGGRFLAINAADSGLYAIDPTTGAATLLHTLGISFSTVGIEMDPVSGVLYACTGPDLLSVDVVSGAVTTIGPIYDDPTCSDLGATWLDVPCLGN